MTEPADRAVLILCDWAEAINGKLYIQGAGFNQLLADAPIPLALAVLWSVPWDQTNTRQVMHLRLMTQDGSPVTDPAGEPLAIKGEFEVGRPPGAKHGDSFPVPLAIKLPPFPLPENDYRWELTVNGKYAAAVSFRASRQIGPQQ